MVDRLGAGGPDVSAQQIISNAQGQAQEALREQNSSPEELARRAAEKKLELKVAQKKTADTKETFSRDDGVAHQWRAASEGKLGLEAQAGAAAWQDSAGLQQKLTQAQKQMFQRAFVDNPDRGAQAGRALANLAQLPGFAAAVPAAPQAGVVQQAVVASPQLEQPIGALLQNAFFGTKGSDATARDDFLRFGLGQVRAGQQDSLKPTGDMLGSLAKAQVPGMGQRAALAMAQRDPTNTAGMKNVDTFVQEPPVRNMPPMAKGRATEVLARADGDGKVRTGLLSVARDETFARQSEANKARVFATIGSGKPSEFRALTDKTLGALRSDNFPQRDGQVSRLLTKMSAQAQRGGAKSVDTQSLLEAANRSSLPAAPTFASTEGLSEEDKRAVQAQNRIKLINYYNRYNTAYQSAEKTFGKAQYLQQVNNLPDLRPPETLDISMLDPETRAFAEDKAQSAKGRCSELQRQQRRKMQELKTSVMPKRQLAAKAEARRSAGTQARYFNPTTGKTVSTRAKTSFGNEPSAVPTGQKGPLPQRPDMRGRTTPSAPPSHASTRAGRPTHKGRIDTTSGKATRDTSLNGLIASLPDDLPVEQKFAQAKQLLAERWQADLQDVVSRLVGEAPAISNTTTDAPAIRPPMPPPTQANVAPRGGTAVQDGWGVPRAASADLGGKIPSKVVRPALTAKRAAADAPPATERLDIPTVRPTAEVRDMGALETLRWKQVSSAERALLANLGWTQQTWDTRDTPAARWPETMRTPFARLKLREKDAVSRLGFSETSWDARVSGVLMQAE